MQTYLRISDHFTDALAKLECNEKTRAYIVSIFDKFRSAQEDFSNQSITLLYSRARGRNDFGLFQGIGDWLFYCESLYPEHLNAASKDYYHSIGKLSYYQCYMLLHKQWKCYEELADSFVPLTQSTRIIIRSP